MIERQNKHVTWTDLLLDTEETQNWFHDANQISAFTSELLQSPRSRPRVTEHEDGIHVVLRGVNLNDGEDVEDMISLRMWLTNEAIITCHGQRLQTIEAVAQQWTDNKPSSNLHFVLRIVELLNDRIADVVDGIDQELDELDEKAKEKPLEVSEKTVSIRRKVAHLRRFLAPQRDALFQLFELASDQNTTTSRSSKVRQFREEAERVTRLIEDLDLARDQASLIREQAMANIAQQQNSRLYIFSVLSVIFMPLTFVTGLLGMNVAGMPGASSQEAFWIVTGLSIIYTICLLIYFKRKHWL